MRKGPRRESLTLLVVSQSLADKARDFVAKIKSESKNGGMLLNRKFRLIVHPLLTGDQWDAKIKRIRLKK